MPEWVPAVLVATLVLLVLLWLAGVWAGTREPGYWRRREDDEW